MVQGGGAGQHVGGVIAVVYQLNRRKRTFGVNCLCHQAQCGDVAGIPQALFGVG